MIAFGDHDTEAGDWANTFLSLSTDEHLVSDRSRPLGAGQAMRHGGAASAGSTSVPAVMPRATSAPKGGRVCPTPAFRSSSPPLPCGSRLAALRRDRLAAVAHRGLDR
jgi:hypothetical protein